MKKNSFFILLSFLILSCSTKPEDPESEKPSEITKEQPKDSLAASIPLVKSENDTNFISGDVIFQTSNGTQSELISLITQSPFTHCGIIMKNPTGIKVLEANGSVRQVPMTEWINSGLDGKYVVMRYKNFQLLQSKELRAKATDAIAQLLKKPYDHKFLWSDESIYCSELVWKIYKRTTNSELCPLKKLQEYDLTSETVKAELKKRYGNDIPLEEPMVSPADIAASDDLNMIFSNY